MLDDKLFRPSSADIRGKADLKELPFIGPFVTCPTDVNGK